LVDTFFSSDIKTLFKNNMIDILIRVAKSI